MPDWHIVHPTVVKADQDVQLDIEQGILDLMHIGEAIVVRLSALGALERWLRSGNCLSAQGGYGIVVSQLPKARRHSSEASATEEVVRHLPKKR